MDLTQWLSDERLLANLIGVHVVLAAILLLSVVLRRILKTGSEQMGRWTGLAWLDSISKEAGKSMRAVLFWSTIALMIGSVASMVVTSPPAKLVREFSPAIGGAIPCICSLPSALACSAS